MSSPSGISSTLIRLGSPPLIIYFLAIGLSPKKVIATARVFFASMNKLQLVGFSMIGLLGITEICTAFACVPIAVLGNFIGVKIQLKLDKNNVQQFSTLYYYS